MCKRGARWLESDNKGGYLPRNSPLGQSVIGWTGGEGKVSSNPSGQSIDTCGTSAVVNSDQSRTCRTVPEATVLLLVGGEVRVHE